MVCLCKAKGADLRSTHMVCLCQAKGADLGSTHMVCLCQATGADLRSTHMVCLCQATGADLRSTHMVCLCQAKGADLRSTHMVCLCKAKGAGLALCTRNHKSVYSNPIQQSVGHYTQSFVRLGFHTPYPLPPIGPSGSGVCRKSGTSEVRFPLAPLEFFWVES